MGISTGIALAFVAMLCWGFGDFLIQKSARKVGDWETLFFISVIGCIIVLPFFLQKDVIGIFSDWKNLAIMGAAGLIICVAALLDFEALRRGKLSVVEPIWSLEVPVSTILAFLVLDERITGMQILLILSLIASMALVSFRDKSVSGRIFIEKGVFLAIIAATTMGGAQFLIGWSARVVDPISINFFIDLVMMIVTLAYLVRHGRLRGAFTRFKGSIGTMLPMSISDKAACLAYTISMTLVPIGVATALSESYIIVAVILGLMVNKERLHVHQEIGLFGSIAAALILATTV
ncbi:MAG: DMT family transporter [Candidatus Paceibacterota bacterium]|jgi:uncharacterized membrane protein